MVGNPFETNSLVAVNICTKPTIYLTFDDGPNKGTEIVLNVLRKNSLKATFFINMSRAKSDPLRQRSLIQRMVTEGHVVGNHGYDHAPMANKQYYESTTIEKIKDDFAKNELEMERLYLKGNYSCPTMEIARLQGDGRFQPRAIGMITGDLRMVHAGWNIEFFPNGQFGKKRGGKLDWMDIKGVTADMQYPIIIDQDVVLMHDEHWAGKEKSLNELITFLSSRYTIKQLTKNSSNSSAIKRPQ